MTTFSPSKYRRIADKLRGRIKRGELSVGDSLPSQTQLMERYGVALGTVRQALLCLQNDGLVYSHRGKGTFVAERAAHPAPAATRTTIGLLVISTQAHDPLVFDRVDTLQDAAEARGFDLSIRVLRDDDTRRALPWAGTKAGLIVWGSIRCEALERLAGAGRPVVMIGESIDGPVPDSVGQVRTSVAELVRIAGELIFGMGHRRVCMVRGDGSAYYHAIGRHFLDETRRADAAELCDQVLLGSPDDERRVLERLCAPQGPPTALLIDGDIKTCRIVHQMQVAGWPVPERVSVVALGAAHPQRVTVPGLTRVEQPLDAALDQAADALAAMSDSGRIVRTNVTPRLHFGRTCRPPEQREPV